MYDAAPVHPLTETEQALLEHETLAVPVVGGPDGSVADEEALATLLPEDVNQPSIFELTNVSPPIVPAAMRLPMRTYSTITAPVCRTTCDRRRRRSRIRS